MLRRRRRDNDIQPPPPAPGRRSTSELSSAEWDALRCFQAAWRGTERSTEPANRLSAERALRRLYRQGGLEWPEIRWCGSPFELFAEQEQLLRDGSRSVWHAVGRSLSEAAWRALWEQIGEPGTTMFKALHGDFWRRTSTGGEGAWSYASRGAEVAEVEHDACRLWTCREENPRQDRAGEYSFDYRWTGDLLPLSAFARSEPGVEEIEVEPLVVLARSAGPWVAHEGVALISERPSCYLEDAQGRLHCWDGPAIAWPDGNGIYRWHGLKVHPRACAPDGLTAGLIQRERNVEVRRMMLERYGQEQFLMDVGARLLDRSRYGSLFETTLSDPSGGATSVRFVEVENATMEPDGSFKRYVLLVPREVRTAKQAVAWTFGLEEHEYVPTAES